MKFIIIIEKYRWKKIEKLNIDYNIIIKIIIKLLIFGLFKVQKNFNMDNLKIYTSINHSYFLRNLRYP